MTTLIEYSLNGPGADYLDFRSAIPSLSLAGQEVSVKGNSGINVVRAGPGVSLDARNLLGGVDVIVFNKNWADYTKDTTSIASTIVFTNTDALTGLTETVLVSSGVVGSGRDKLVFGDGSVVTDKVRLALATNANVAITAITAFDATVTNNTPSAFVPAALNSEYEVKATSSGGTGAVFAQTNAGMNGDLTGTGEVDKIYVARGGTVDARNLLGGKDIIYFTGRWSDYTKSLSVTNSILFTRVLDNGMTETVLVADGKIGSTRDQLVFADGAVVTNNAKAAILINTTGGLTSVTGFDLTIKTPGLTIEKILTYAADTVGAEVPVLSDYTDAGIAGVTTAADVPQVNSFLALADVDPSTQSAVEAIAVAANKVEAYANNNTNPLPTLADYQTLGVLPASSTQAQANLLNSAVESKVGEDVDRASELVALANAARVVQDAADGGTLPSNENLLAALNALGITTVNANNIGEVAASIAASGTAGSDTLPELVLQVATVISAFPTIGSVAITSATGVVLNTLNTGDVVSITVNLSEATHVQGVPQLALDIGGTTVQANYFGGSGNSALVFKYTIQQGQTDANGISLPVNALRLNGGSLLDNAGNAANLNTVLVSDNVSYKVDTTAAPAPTVSLVADTGLSASDGITQNGKMRVQGLEDGASWEYSSNGGAAWTAGATGTAVTLSTLTSDMVSASLNGGSIGSGTAATVSSWTVNPSSVTAWLLMSDGGTFTKGVQVEFSENAGVLQVKTLGAAYVGGNHIADWDATPGKLTQAVATSASASGYGVERMLIVGDVVTPNYLSSAATTVTVLDESFMLGSGSYTSGQILARQTDAVGNTSVNSTGIGGLSAVTVDGFGPTVSSLVVSAVGAQGGVLNAGDTIIVTANMSESTNVTGVPKLDVNIGGTVVQAEYVSGTGTTALTFSYTIQTNQTDANGISLAANALNLNGGTVRDAAGNNANLATLAVVDNGNYKVDTTAATAPRIVHVMDDIGSVQGPVTTGGSSDDTVLVVRVSVANTNAVAGDSVQLFDGSTVVAPLLLLTQSHITQGYVDVSTSVLTSGTSYSFNAKIIDIAGNPSDSSLNHNVTIDATASLVNSVAITAAQNAVMSTLNAGDVVSVTVSMNEVITVSGVPQLALNIGGTVVQASYTGGTGSRDLVFSYTIQANQTDANGISLAANALSLNGGTMRDAAGNAANITTLAVADNASYKVDTTVANAPSIASVSDDVGNIMGTVSNGGSSDDTLLVVRVNLNNTNAVANDTVQLNNGSATLTAPVIISANDVSLGYVDISTTALNIATTYAFNAKITDAAGNVSAASANYGVSIDTAGPTVNSLTLSATNAQGGFLNAGDVITVTANMSEAAIVSGTPQLALNIGGTVVQASYTGGSASTALTFSYTIQANQTDANGISLAANALSLNGGTVRDAAGNNANLATAAVADNGSFKVDTTTANAPTIVSASDDVGAITGTVVNGGSTDDTLLSVRVGLDNSVVVGDSVQLNNGLTTVAVPVTVTQAHLTAGYVDISTMALASGTTYAFNAKITDAAGNVSAASANYGVSIDTAGPTVSSLTLSATNAQGGFLNAGDVITVTANMSEAAIVSGTPQLALNIGGTVVQASYTGGSASTALTFSYTIQANQTDANGISLAANALSLNGGTVRDAAGNNANLATAAVADNGSFKVDTTTANAPTIASASDDVGAITGTVVNGGSTDDTLLSVRVGLDNSVVVGDSVQLNNGLTTVAVPVTVTQAHLTAGYVDISTMALASGTTYAFNAKITDAAGNVSAASANYGVSIDTAGPTVSSLTLSATNAQGGFLNAGDVITVTANMSEAAIVSGTPQLALNIGGTVVQASYTGGSASTALTFSYTIQANQTDANGISLAANALSLNGGTVRDALGNNANLATAAVADNGSFKVDTTTANAPTIASASDDVGAIIGTVVNGGSTDDTLLSVRVGLNNSVVVGDSVQLNNGLTSVAVPVTVTQAHLTAGYVDISTLALASGTTYAFNAKITDAAGNVSAASANYGVSIDTAGPTVSSLTLSATNAQGGFLNAGDVITVTANMSEAAIVSGTPQLALNIGGTVVQASYTGGSASTALTFSYTIQANQTDANGISLAANALSLNGGTVRDAAGNNANLATAAVADNGSFKVDTTTAAAPTVRLVTDTGSSSSDGITQNGKMRVQGLEAGASWQYSSDGGTTWAVGAAGTAVTLSTLTPDMISASLNGGSFGGSYAATVSSWTLTPTGTYTAWLLTAGGNYTKAVQVEFSSNSAGALQVKALGAAYAEGIHLNDWDSTVNSRNAQSLATSASAGGYGVERLSIVGDVVTSGYLTTTETTLSTLDESFVLGNGTYTNAQILVRQTDAAGNTSANSSGIGGLSAVTVDNTGATVSSLTLSATNAQGGFLNAGDVITVTANMSEAAIVSGTPQLALNIGGTVVQASYTGGSASTALTFSYTIQANQTDANGISLAANALSLNGGTVRDAAGNNANLATAAVADNGSFKVDTTTAAAPTVRLVTDTGSSSSDGITQNGKMRVQGLEAGASWQYSSDGGTTWAVGAAGTAVTLSTLTPDMISASLNGGSFGGSYAATVSSWTLTPTGTYTAWLLTAGGNYTKAVQVEFSSNSAGALQVKALGAAYAEGIHLNDWDSTVNSRNAQSLATSASAGGYGVERLSIVGDVVTSGYLTTTETMLSTLDESFVLGNGTYTNAQILVRQTDAAGNTSANSSGIGGLSAVTVDNTGATVSSLTLSATNAQGGFLNAGDVITVTANMSEAAIVSGTPQLALNIGGTVVQASYTGGSASTALTFSYTIQANQTDANGISLAANALSLNGGTVRDAAGNNANLATTAVADNGSFKVDNTAPTAPVSAPTAYIDNVGSVTSNSSSASTTDDTTPGILIGTSLAGTPSLYVNGTKVTSTYDSVAGSLTPTVALAAGSHALTYSLTDAAGNESGRSAALNVTVDTTAPTAPVSAPTAYIDNVGSVTSNSSSASTTDDTTPGILIGTSLAGTPSLYVNGTKVTSTYDAVAGSLTPTVALAAGSHALTYSLTDAAGNESGRSAALNVTVDTTAPTAPVSAPTAYIDNVGSVTSNSSSASTTDDTTPGILIGTSLAGTPSLYVNGTKVTSTYDAVAGSLTPTVALAAGAHALTYSLTDAAGNESGRSAALNVTVDTTAPTAPVSAPTAYIDNVGSVTSNSSSASTTDDTTPGIVIGTSLGGTPSLYVNGTKVTSTYDSVAGSLTPTVALAAGSHALTYSLTDAAGNESGRSAPLNLIVNNAPVLTDTALNFGAVIQDAGVPTGVAGNLVSSFVGGVTDNDAGAVKGIAVTGVANGTLYFSTNGGTQWTAVSNASNANALLLGSDASTRIYFKPDAGFNGTASSAVTFRAWDQTTGVKGTYISTSINGNESSFSSATDTISEQVVRPVTMSVVSVDNVVTNSEALVLNGTSNAGATVALSINSASSVNVVADVSGNWAYNSSLVRYVMVRKTIGANNTIFSIKELSVFDTAGTNIATGKTITSSSNFAFGGLSNINDNSTSTHAEVMLSTNADVWFQVDLGGLFQVSQITALARAGNDEQAERLSDSSIFASAADMSSSTKAQLTASPFVSKTVMTFSTSSPSFAFNNPVATTAAALLTSGNNSITATEVVSGVTSSASRTVQMVPNTPSAPVSYVDNAGSITSTSSTAASTDDTTPGINVGAGLVATPKLYVDGVFVASTYVTATGVLTPTTALTTGAHAIAYSVTDAAGNESGRSAALSITVDSTAPTTPGSGPTSYIDNVGSITSVSSTAATTDDTTPGILIGTSLAGTPSLYVNGTKVTATYDAATGALTPTVALSAGSNALTYSLTDAAGNESGRSAALNITVDTTAAAAPTVQLANDTGSSSSDGITQNGKMLVQGIEAGSTWEYSTTGGTAWTTGGASSAVTLASLQPSMLNVVLNGPSILASTSALPLTWDTSIPGTITSWLGFYDGTYTKGVKVEFSSNQQGLLAVKAIEGGYVAGDHREDWSTVAKISAPLAPDTYTGYYGVESLSVANSGDVTGVNFLSTSLTGITAQQTTFDLAVGNYAAGQVLVRQTDTAGNVSVNGSIGSAVRVIAPASNAAAVKIDLVGTLLANESGLTYSYDSGSFYKMVNTPASWNDANALAAATSVRGFAGHVVHVNSAAENAYVNGVNGYNGTTAGWLGGSDKNGEGDWKWYYGHVAGESYSDVAVSGSIKVIQGVNGAYGNWGFDEPNGGTSENYMQMNHSSLASGAWLDIYQTNSTATNKYLIEYEGSGVLNRPQTFVDTQSIKLTSSEAGAAYLVNANSTVTSVANILALGDSQWNTVSLSNGTVKVLSQETFDNASQVTGWTSTANNSTASLVTDLGGSLGSFLGKFNNLLGNQVVSKTYNFGVENANKTVTIDFDLNELDSWDGEVFSVFVNNTVTSAKAYHYSQNGIGDGGINVGNLSTGLNGGGTDSTWTEEVHHYSLKATLNANGSVKLGFGSALSEAVSNESWGIDNLVIATAPSNGSPSLSLSGLSDGDYKLYNTDIAGNLSLASGDVIKLKSSKPIAQLNLVETVMSNTLGITYSYDTGSFYKYSSIATNWNNATLSSANLSIMNGVKGHLVHANTQVENEYIATILNGTTGWMGGSDKLTEGVWQWYYGSTAGETFSNINLGNPVISNSEYSNWGLNEPNGGTNESYLQMNYSSLPVSKWLDIAPTGSAMTNVYVAEFEGSGILNRLSYSNTSVVNVSSTEVGTAYLVKAGNTVNSISDINNLSDNNWNSTSVGAAATNSVLSFENFATAPSGWSNNTHTTLGGEMNGFLGKFTLDTGNSVTSKTYDFGVARANQVVKIEFDMYEIDSWDGEKFNVFINDGLTSSANYHNSQSTIYDGGKNLGDLSNSNNGGLNNFTEEAHHYSLQATLDSLGRVKLGFGSALDQAMGDESWGIDNVEIATVNAGTTLSLAGLSAGNYNLYTADIYGNLSVASQHSIAVI